MPRASERSASSRRRKSLLSCLALVTFAAVGLVPGCGTDAVGIEACRQVESARCDLAPTCAGFDGSPDIRTEEQVKNCRELYRDQCLVGLENTKAEAGQADIDACVKALKKTAACDDPKKSTAGDCGVELRDNVDPTIQPCEVLQNPHWLEACKWLDKNKKIKVGDGDGAGGGGGAGAGGGTPSLTVTDGATTAETTGTGATTDAATTGGFDGDP